jgi:hypothetical protein
LISKEQQREQSIRGEVRGEIQKLMTIARTMNALVTGMKDATRGSMMSFSDCGERTAIAL